MNVNFISVLTLKIVSNATSTLYVCVCVITMCDNLKNNFTVPVSTLNANSLKLKYQWNQNTSLIPSTYYNFIVYLLECKSNVYPT